MPRRLFWTVFALAFGSLSSLSAIQLYYEQEAFINRNVAQYISGNTAPADAAFREFADKLSAPDAALAYAERGHRLYLQGGDGTASYAAALQRDPACHLAEVYSADAEIDAEDYDGALRKLHPESDDAPEGVEWGMYALALQLRGHPEDHARIREALESSRARSRVVEGYETSRAWVLSLIADQDLVNARRHLNEMATLDIVRPDFTELEEKLQAYEIEKEMGGMTRAHDLREEARGLQQEGKYAEALDRCAEAGAIRDTDEAPDLAAEINYTWSEHLWATGDKMGASAKLRAALATTHSGGLRQLISARIAPLKAEAAAAFGRKAYAATLALCETPLLITPRDHELGAMKALSLAELARYPEAIRAWIEISTQEEAPDKEAKVDYDKRGTIDVFVKAYTVLIEADKTGADSRALCAGLIGLREKLVESGLTSVESHFCLGVAFDMQDRSRDADAEWALARGSARPEEKARLEDLIGPYVGRREAKAVYGSNYDMFLKYGSVVEQLFNEWTSSENPLFSNPLRKKLSPAQQARWDEIIILIGRLHALVKEINDVKHQARVSKDVLEASQPTQEDVDRVQRVLDYNKAYVQSRVEEGRRIQEQVEKKMADFWRP